MVAISLRKNRLYFPKIMRKDTIMAKYKSAGPRDAVITKKILYRQRVLIALAILFVIYGIIFYYIPLGGWIMAFENYKQARQMFNSVKEFYALFRPDRSALVDHGVPLEQVYLIEDQLFNA
jgi:ABC-type polysaccharide transport system permease subunit